MLTQIRTILQESTKLRVSNSTLSRMLGEVDQKNQWVAFNDFFDNNIRIDDRLNSCVVLTTESSMATYSDAFWEWIQKRNHIDFRFIILSQKSGEQPSFPPIPKNLIYLVLPVNTSIPILLNVVEHAFTHMQLNQERDELRLQLSLSDKEISSFARIGRLLGQEHSFEKLIHLILFEFRKLVSSDSGSIYIIERNKYNKSPTHLRFKSTYLDLDLDEFLVPIDKSSIAGYVALTGEPLMIDDAYKIPKAKEYSFNDTLDKKYNYRTKSMIVLPMKNHKNQVIGVIQLINRKANYLDKLTIDNTDEIVMPFSNRDLMFVNAMAGQAGVALENNFLLQDIHDLFEGFVTASVTAIEQRDISTSGHSFRVAALTVELAKMVDQCKKPCFANISFTSEQIREIRYAGLLHDFGKVGVKEEVLVKAKKLYPYELDIIRLRYHLFREIIQRDYFQRKSDLVEQFGNSDLTTIKHLNHERDEKLQKLKKMFQYILETNEPNIMKEDDFEMLNQIEQYKMELHNGDVIQLLEKNEFLSLATRKGSLNPIERLEIESHVKHTYSFLKQIPWTEDLKNIPNIAHGHHEKLDGSGYPQGLKAKNISIQTRMLTISDIYDALTAHDRPYKPSMSPEKALDIISYEVREKHIDPDLFDLFIEAKVFNSCSVPL